MSTGTGGKRRAWGYARVSSDEQGRTGTSLDGQETEIRRYANAQGWRLCGLRREIESGGAERLESRVELQALLREVAPGDAILVTRVDRWSRDLPHAVASARELARRGVSLFAIQDGIDASTPYGDQMLGVMAWASDLERTRIKTRTVGRRNELRDMGFWVEGIPPLGYRVVGRRLVIDPEAAAVVGEVFARCIDGESLSEILAWLHSKGHRGDKKKVNMLLRRRWYMGEFRRTDGTWFPNHDQIIEPETWHRAQRAMDSRRKGGRKGEATSRTAGWLCRGLGRCVCGSRMAASYGDGRDYYACGGRLRGTECDEQYARQDLVDAEVEAEVVARLGELSAELSRARTVGNAEPDRAGIAVAIARNKTKRARVISAFVDGMIDAAEVQKRTAPLDAEAASLASEMAIMGAPLTNAERAEVLADVKVMQSRWARLDIATKRQILSLLAESIVFSEGRAEIEWSSVESLRLATVGKHLRKTTVRSRLKTAAKKSVRR
jgi:site-specific DNA recombinase